MEFLNGMDTGTLIVLGLVVGVPAILLLVELVSLIRANGFVKVLSFTFGVILTLLLAVAGIGSLFSMDETAIETLFYVAVAVAAGWLVQSATGIPKLWCRAYLVAFSAVAAVVWRFIGEAVFLEWLGKQETGAMAVVVGAILLGVLSLGGSLLGAEDTLNAIVPMEVEHD